MARGKSAYCALKFAVIHRHVHGPGIESQYSAPSFIYRGWIMITAHRIGLALALAASVALGGCAKSPSGKAHSWMSMTAPIAKPAMAKHTVHRHKTRVVRHAPRATPEVIDPDLVTGSVTPVAAPVAPATVLEACKQRLYLETATSTEELRAAEAACKDIIVGQPIGGGAN
jgi:hypothetical protein